MSQQQDVGSMLSSVLLYGGVVESEMPLTGHAMTYDPTSQQLYMFGGIPSVSPTAVEATAAASCPLYTAYVPTLLGGFSSIAHAHCSCQGSQESRQALPSASSLETKDTLRRRLKKTVWERLGAPNQPSSRHGHWLMCYNQRIFVLGGRYWHLNDAVATGDFAYSLERRQWLKLPSFNLPNRFAAAVAVVQMSAEGNQKTYQIDGEELYVGGHAAFVFGGLNEVREVSSGLFFVDFRKMEVTQLFGRGETPPAQFKGSMVWTEHHGGALLLVDGLRDDQEEKKSHPAVWLYSLSTNLWRKVAVAPGTVRSQLVGLGPLRRSEVVLYGGMPRRNKKARSQEFFAFDLEGLYWVGKKENSSSLCISSTVHDVAPSDDQETITATTSSSSSGDETVPQAPCEYGLPGLTSHVMVTVAVPWRALAQCFGATGERKSSDEGMKPSSSCVGEKTSEENFSVVAILCYGGSIDSPVHRHTDGEPVGLPTEGMHVLYVAPPTLKELVARAIHQLDWSSLVRTRVASDPQDTTLDDLF